MTPLPAPAPDPPASPAAVWPEPPRPSVMATGAARPARPLAHTRTGTAGRAGWDLICCEALAQLAAMPTGSVDAVVIDPPYSTGGAFRGDRTQALPSTKYVSSGTQAPAVDFTGDNRDQRSYAFWLTLVLTEARRVTRFGGALITFTDWRQLPTTTDVVQAGGWVWRGIGTWVKSPSRSRPALGGFWAQAEHWVWCTNGPLVPYPGAPALPGVIWADAPRTADRVHITQKPDGLMEHLVQVAPPAGLVLDAFAGSGSTGVACVRQGRRFLGLEEVPELAENARQRIAAAAADWGDVVGSAEVPTLFAP